MYAILLGGTVIQCCKTKQIQKLQKKKQILQPNNFAGW